MNNIASILVLIFLAITFIQSAADKLFDWKESIFWLREHFFETIFAKIVPTALAILVILEIASGVLSTVGAIRLIVFNDRIFGFYGSIFCCISLLIMLLAERIAKDYEGAKTITIYFIPAVLVVYWLG
jgi:uncharacterized membrane protein YphA (DoxX/SURF4 family)